jgi:hypothetical protein
MSPGENDVWMEFERRQDGQAFDRLFMLHILAEEQGAARERRRCEQHAIPPAESILVFDLPRTLRDNEVVWGGAELAPTPDQQPRFISWD